MSGEIKVHNGSSFNWKSIKVWNGSAWVVKPLKFWNGTEWKLTNDVYGYDTDAQAFITAVGTLTTQQEVAINDLVVGLKANGTWSKYKAIYPFIGGTASSHKWNLKDPRDLDAAFRITYSGGLTHSSAGVLGNGSSGYMNTHFSPASNLTINSETMSFYTTTETTETSTDPIIMGAGNSFTQVSLLSVDETTIFCRLNDTLRFIGNTIRTGLFTACKNGSSTIKIYKDDVLKFTTTGTGSLPTLPHFILTLNYGGYPYGDGYSNQNVAYAGLGDGLSDTEIANDYTVIQAYQIALGREV